MPDPVTEPPYKFHGAIEGTLVSIDVSDQQSFGIHSVVEGGTIRCYFKDGLPESFLGARVYVFGLIRQDERGHKISIHVEELKILPTTDEVPTLDLLTKMLRGEG